LWIKHSREDGGIEHLIYRLHIQIEMPRVVSTVEGELREGFKAGADRRRGDVKWIINGRGGCVGRR